MCWVSFCGKSVKIWLSFIQEQFLNGKHLWIQKGLYWISDGFDWENLLIGKPFLFAKGFSVLISGEVFDNWKSYFRTHCTSNGMHFSGNISWLSVGAAGGRPAGCATTDTMVSNTITAISIGNAIPVVAGRPMGMQVTIPACGLGLEEFLKWKLFTNPFEKCLKFIPLNSPSRFRFDFC